MQLYILSKDPIESANLIPDKYKFKMLIELGQLICSAGLSDIYKAIPQGKELQGFVLDNKGWVYWYFKVLYDWTLLNINTKFETMSKLNTILQDFACALLFEDAIVPTHAYFRYAKEYKCDIPSKTLLSIDDCIAEYKKYLQWKMREV